jgi:serine/threonine-protein kinase
VSPQNIIVSFDGVTKVVDFGLAKLTGAVDDGTHGSPVRGKAAYLAPEQIQNAIIDRRLDVFALGIILYVLTTGVHPFVGRTVPATLRKISSPDRVTPPSDLMPDYPSELEAIVLRCLEKEPGRRFATADELVWALESSIPAELRATDQDVAVLVRSVAGDVGVRRLFAVGSVDADPRANGAPRGSSDGGAYRDSRYLREAPTKAHKRVGAKTGDAPQRRGAYRPVLLCAGLVGTVVTLTLASALRGTAVETMVAESPAVIASGRQPRDAIMGPNIGRPLPSFKAAPPGSPGHAKAAGGPGRFRPTPGHVRAAKSMFVARKSPTAKEVGFGDP